VTPALFAGKQRYVIVPPDDRENLPSPLAPFIQFQGEITKNARPCWDSQRFTCVMDSSPVRSVRLVSDFTLALMKPFVGKGINVRWRS